MIEQVPLLFPYPYMGNDSVFELYRAVVVLGYSRMFVVENVMSVFSPSLLSCVRSLTTTYSSNTMTPHFGLETRGYSR